MEHTYLDDFEDDLQEESEKIKDAASIMDTKASKKKKKASINKEAKKESAPEETIVIVDDNPEVPEVGLEDNPAKSGEPKKPPKENKSPNVEVKKVETATTSKSPDDFWDDEEDRESIWGQISTWRTLAVIFVILFVFSIYTDGFNFDDSSPTGATVSLPEVESKVVSFLNDYILQPPFTASIEKSAEEDWLYKLQLNVAGKSMDSYVTKDGSLLFPQWVDLDAPPKGVGPQLIERFEVGPDNDPMVGDPTAPILIIEFSDFQCPFCAKWVEEVYPLIKEQYVDTGKVKLVFRDFPLTEIHPRAELAAVASECAFEQGTQHFWTFHDRLFNNQDNLNEETFRGWAVELNFEMSRYDSCINNNKYQKEVYEDLADGQSVGVTGTPTFFVNGRIVTGAQPFQVFQGIIEDELKKTGGTPTMGGEASPVRVLREEESEGSLEGPEEDVVLDIVDEPPIGEELIIEEIADEPSAEEEIVVEEPEERVVKEAVSVRKLNMGAIRWRFVPQDLTVNADDAVELTIISKDLDFTFAIPELGVSKQISSGKNVFTFVASRKGTFEFICSDCEDYRGMTGMLVVG